MCGDGVQALETRLIAEVRRHMNGVVSASIRRGGASYPFCLGVPLPTLREIGKCYAPNQGLARTLLSRTMRESLLLASIVGDPSLHVEDDTQLWLNTFIHDECVDVACADYFWRVDGSVQLAYAWLFDAHLSMQRAGISLLANLYRRIPLAAAPPAPFTLGMLYERMARLAACGSLFQPLLFLAQWLSRRGEAAGLLETLGSDHFPDGSAEARRQIAECIRFELGLEGCI